MDRFLGDAFGVLSCQFWSIVLQSVARLPIHTLNYWTEQSVVPGFKLGVCLSATFLIVDPSQSCVQNLAVQQDFYILLGVPLKRSC